MVTFHGKQYETWEEARRVAAEEAEAVAVAEPEAAETPEPEAVKPRRRVALTDRHRPSALSEIVGQPEAVEQLAAFASDPYPTAFILAGDTGVGKTSAAIALASELGCTINTSPSEFGGVFSIPSGEHDADTLREVWPNLRLRPLLSKSGWKVLIVNEVEKLKERVEMLWLDKLEDIPPFTVVVFTTNALDSLPARFVDRCIGGVIEFRETAEDLGDPARSLARSIWSQETGGGVIPADVLEQVIGKAAKSGRLSLRRVVQAMVPFLAKNKGVANAVS